MDEKINEQCGQLLLNLEGIDFIINNPDITDFILNLTIFKQYPDQSLSFSSS